mgnify:CR=1 FL=1
MFAGRLFMVSFSEIAWGQIIRGIEIGTPLKIVLSNFQYVQRMAKYPCDVRFWLTVSYKRCLEFVTRAHYKKVNIDFDR